nr:MAK10-like protein [Tanacetum cinerariifolium]
MIILKEEPDQVQIFYDHVNDVTRRTYDQSAVGKLRDHNAEESWALLEDLALDDKKSWNNPRDFSKPVKAIALPQDVLSTSDRHLIELETQVQSLMEAHLAPTQPTKVNKITTSCEIYSGPHNTQYCIKDLQQAFVENASSCTDEAGGLVSNFMASQDARLSKFEADFKQQQSEMTNKIDTVLKAITDRRAGTLPSDMVKNPKLNEIHICNLGDYSKPSHEGYMNIIELPSGNSVVPLRFDTIRLVQNGCSFHGLRSEDPNHHLKDFLKLMDSLDLDCEKRKRMRLRLFQFSIRDQASNWLERLPARSITIWENLTTRFLAQFFPPGRTLLGFMECKVVTLIKEAILLMGRSESIFRMTSNTMYQLPLEPSRHEEFDNLLMNFILDQEEKVKQLEEYMGVIGSDSTQLSLEVVGEIKGRNKDGKK